MEWPNETISDFLSLYEGEPYLWDSKNLNHKNRNDEHDAWVRIKSRLKDGNISIGELKKRDNLMATYRKLRRKVAQSIKSGVGADEIFKHDWPFYSVMSTFLDNVYMPRKTKSSEDSEEIESDSESCNENIININTEIDKTKLKIALPKRMKLKEPEKRMDEAYDCLKQMSQKLKTPQDECSLYTQLLCQKLRGLQEGTREIAMLEIDRLIYNLKQKEILASNSYNNHITYFHNHIPATNNTHRTYPSPYSPTSQPLTNNHLF